MTSAEIVDEARARAPAGSADREDALCADLGPIVVVDLETTGLDPKTASVIEIGAVKLCAGRPRETFHDLVDPGRPIPAIVGRVTGLTDGMLAGRPRWSTVGPRFGEFAAGARLVAHNAAFEEAFLASFFPAGTEFLDTLELACVLRPELPGHSLAVLAERLLGRRERHRALDDTLDTLDVLCLLHAEVRSGQHSAVARRVSELEPRWAWAPLFGAATARGTDERAHRSRHLAAVETQAAPMARTSVPASAVTSPRESNPGLAAHLRRVAEYGGFHVVEVQPGRECSTAVQALLASRQGSEGPRAVYAAATLAGAARCAELATLAGSQDGSPTAASGPVPEADQPVAAGGGATADASRGAMTDTETREVEVLRRRDGCLRPDVANALLRDPAALGFEGLAPVLHCYLTSWLERCPERDLGGFGGWLAAREPRMLAVRDRLSCGLACDESRCQAEGGCAWQRAGARAALARLVATDHATLLARPEVAEGRDLVLVDDADQLASAADALALVTVTARELREIALCCRGGAGGGMLRALAAPEEGAAGPRDGIEIATRLESQVQAVGERLLAAVSASSSAIPAFGARTSASWARVAASLDALGRDAIALAAELRRLLDGAEARNVDATLCYEARRIAGRLEHVARVDLADLMEQSRMDLARSARAHRRRDGLHEWTLRWEPVAGARAILERIAEGARSVVLLSPAMQIAGDLAPALIRLGVESRVASVSAAQPDPGRGEAGTLLPRPRTGLSLVRGMPNRGKEAPEHLADFVARLAGGLGGRTVVLFSNRARLAEVATRLRPRLEGMGFALLAQERVGSGPRLIAEFAADPRTVLLGERALWDVVTLPAGEACCVVVDKLPFPRPDDPLNRARAERLKRNRQSDFRVLSLTAVTAAVRRLWGRLSAGETGAVELVIASVDPDQSWVGEIVASLPEPVSPYVGSPDDVVARVIGELRPELPSVAQPIAG